VLFRSQKIKAEIDRNIQTVLESGQYVMGPMLKKFEAELAAYHGMQFAVGTGNGTDSIWLGLMALGIGPGDEVITHPNTFFATAEAIWIAGATVVFVDCCPKTTCIDPQRIEAAITPRTAPIRTRRVSKRSGQRGSYSSMMTGSVIRTACGRPRAAAGSLRARSADWRLPLPGLIDGRQSSL